MTDFFLGKKPARLGAVTFKIDDYIYLANIRPPRVFGHVSATTAWGQLGNDKAGNCVWAGAAHETMIWTGAVRRPVPPFTDDSALKDYSRFTGYILGDDITDEGTDMSEAAKLRRQVGITDAEGKLHQIKAYAALPAGDVDTLAKATYLFGATGVGVTLTQTALDQFDNRQPWYVVKGRQRARGGHYVPCVGRNSRGNFMFITWGRLQAAEPAWVERYMDEGLAYFSDEYLHETTKLTPENFDSASLLKDLASLNQGK